MEQISVTGGNMYTDQLSDNGGGIRNAGTLLLTACAVSNNYAYNHGGGIYNSGTLTLTNSTRRPGVVRADVNLNGVRDPRDRTVAGTWSREDGRYRFQPDTAVILYPALRTDTLGLQLATQWYRLFFETA